MMFMWLGWAVAGMMSVIGLALLSSYAINFAWRKFKDGKALRDVVKAYHERDQ